MFPTTIIDNTRAPRKVYERTCAHGTAPPAAARGVHVFIFSAFIIMHAIRTRTRITSIN